MTPKQLLTPRYKKGKPLNWWEYRYPGDMPQFLKCKSNYNPDVWICYPATFTWLGEGEGWLLTVNLTTALSSSYIKDKLPATKEEYDDYIIFRNKPENLSHFELFPYPF